MGAHLPTPEILKAVYGNLFVATQPERLRRLTDLVESTELNALFLDIRSNGSPILAKTDEETRIILESLHERGIYLAARLVSFQGGPRGWYDPASEARWRQIADASARAVELGFDEINYDYVRYGAAREPKSPTPEAERGPVIRSFAEFLREKVGDRLQRPISADIFGFTLLGPQALIGQRLADFTELFDYVMPMPYPSHWRPGTFGMKNPAHEPYQVLQHALSVGEKSMAEDQSRRARLRSWIQAFDLDSFMRFYRYAPWHVREQIRACDDVHAQGWCAWNAGGNYDAEAFR
ncbi:Putative glycoside hydrolase [Minicystis rosea]|nr:Putative glycoside hydrolase [Minicystis rosea]